MIRSVELFTEPRDILNKMKAAYVEMLPEDHGFLCGLIRDNQPRKIVEVGVAGGGTTCVVMNCLSMMNSDAVMYSIDINEMCYRRADKKTGWQLDEIKNHLNNYRRHRFLLGKALPQVVDQLGENIDFVILDTTHTMPGELLDFLCILPHLSPNAIVVVHDIWLNLRFSGDNSIATAILLASVSGEKYMNIETEVPNIGGFRVTKETIDNVENVFSVLSITWRYLLEIELLIAYRNTFKSYYSESCLRLFDKIVWLQYQFYGRNWANVDNEIERCLKLCNSGRKVFLYGTGIRGMQLKNFILQKGCKVDGFVVSDSFETESFKGIDEKIYNVSDMPEKECNLILATPASEVFYSLLEKGINFHFFSERFFLRVAEKKDVIL